MVPRQLGRRAAFIAAAVFAVALALTPAASASNRRISISNYQWSNPSIQLDLGEHVTWYWVGPDTIHSVTGESPNALQWDSDAGIGLPHHKIGDSYRIDFDNPGTYDLVCKLHSTVRGTVTVSDTPGDPASEQDPVPKSQVDLRPPKMRQICARQEPDPRPRRPTLVRPRRPGQGRRRLLPDRRRRQATLRGLGEMERLRRPQ